jgi:hypothetical protein
MPAFRAQMRRGREVNFSAATITVGLGVVASGRDNKFNETCDGRSTTFMKGRLVDYKCLRTIEFQVVCLQRFRLREVTEVL